MGQVEPTPMDQIGSGDTSPAASYGKALAMVSQMMAQERQSQNQTAPAANDLTKLLDNLETELQTTQKISDTRIEETLTALKQNSTITSQIPVEAFQAIEDNIDANIDPTPTPAPTPDSTGTIRVTIDASDLATDGNSLAIYQYKARGELIATPDTLAAACNDADTISQSQIEAQDDGSYLIRGVRASGNASVNFTQGNGGASTEEISVRANETTEINLKLVALNTLGFRVESTLHDTLIVDIANVDLHNIEFSTNEDHTIANLPEGRFFMTLSSSLGQQILSRYITVPTQEALLINLNDVTDANTLSGTITDADSNPISDAIVLLKPDNSAYQMALSSSSGSYELNHLKAGNYTLIISKNGYQASKVENLSIGSDTNNQDVQLSTEQSKGSIAGFAYFNDLAAHTGIDITIEQQGGGFTDQFGTLSDGAYLIGPLDPGTYTLNFGKAGDSDYTSVQQVDINVIAGVTTVIEAPATLVHKIGNISGSLTIPEGFGATTNLKLELLASDNSQISSFTIADSSVNSYAFNQVPAGEGYSIKLSGTHADGQQIVEQLIPAFDLALNTSMDAGALNVILNNGSISGTLNIPADFGETGQLSLQLLNAEESVIQTFSITDSSVTSFSFTSLTPGSGYQLKLSGENSAGIKVVEQIVTDQEVALSTNLEIGEIIVALNIGSISGTLNIPSDFGETSNLNLELLEGDHTLVSKFSITDSNVTSFSFANLTPGSGYQLKLSGATSDQQSIIEQRQSDIVVTLGTNTETDPLSVLFNAANLTGFLNLPAGFGDLSNLTLALTDASDNELKRITPTRASFALNYITPGSGYTLTLSGSNFKGTAIEAATLSGIELVATETNDLSATPLSVTLQQSVTDGDNQKPELTSFAADVTAAPDIVLNYQVQDPEADPITCTINWGDGSGVQTIDNCYNTPATHSYSEMKEYTILFTASDGHGSITYNQPVTVVYYPFLTALEMNLQPGKVVELMGSVQNTSTLTIDWGDGTTAETLNEGLDAFQIFHQYSTTGSKTFSLSGDSGTPVERTILITDNLPPTINLGATNLQLNQQQLAFSVFDPEDDAFTCQVDWGDNSIELIEVCNQESLNHTFSAIGDFNIVVTATDAQSQTSTVTLPAAVTTLQADTLTVDNLSVTAKANHEVLLTGAITAQNFLRLDISWGDGNSDRLNAGDNSIDFTNLQVNKVYPALDQEYTITLTLIDDQGASSSAQRTIFVAGNYPPRYPDGRC